MNLRPPSKAFDPFIRHTVRVTCRGEANVYKDTLKVAVLAGATPSGSAGSQLQPSTADALTLVLRVADWRAEFPPALATLFESEEIGRCTVQSLQRVGGRWHLACTRDQKARAT